MSAKESDVRGSELSLRFFVETGMEKCGPQIRTSCDFSGFWAFYATQFCGTVFFFRNLWLDFINNVSTLSVIRFRDFRAGSKSMTNTWLGKNLGSCGVSFRGCDESGGFGPGADFQEGLLNWESWHVMAQTWACDDRCNGVQVSQLHFRSNGFSMWRRKWKVCNLLSGFLKAPF